jgi:hypothetical protein
VLEPTSFGSVFTDMYASKNLTYTQEECYKWAFFIFFYESKSNNLICLLILFIKVSAFNATWSIIAAVT